MKQLPRYVRHEINCPEGRGETELLSAWCAEGGRQVLNGIICNNPKLRDLSGTDCQWSCWDQISPKNHDRIG